MDCTERNVLSLLIEDSVFYLSQFGGVLRLCLVNVTRPVGSAETREHTLTFLRFCTEMIKIHHLALNIVSKERIYINLCPQMLTVLCDSSEVAE